MEIFLFFSAKKFVYNADAKRDPVKVVPRPKSEEIHEQKSVSKQEIPTSLEPAAKLHLTNKAEMVASGRRLNSLLKDHGVFHTFDGKEMAADIKISSCSMSVQTPGELGSALRPCSGEAYVGEWDARFYLEDLSAVRAVSHNGFFQISLHGDRSERRDCLTDGAKSQQKGSALIFRDAESAEEAVSIINGAASFCASTPDAIFEKRMPELTRIAFEAGTTILTSEAAAKVAQHGRVMIELQRLVPRSHIYIIGESGDDTTEAVKG